MKMYKQPEIEITDVMPQSIICSSVTPGGDAPGDTIGD